MASTLANSSTDSCIKIKKTRHFYPFQYFQMNLLKKNLQTASLYLVASTLSSQQGERIMVLALIL